MICYLDTSALAKKYNHEKGSEAVRKLIEQAESLLTSALTELELTSAIERGKREGRIDSPNSRLIHSLIEKDIHTHVVNLVAINTEVIKAAKRLIRQRRLRVQDAIQLASVLMIDRSAGGNVPFVCADHALLEAARLEGLECHNVS